MHLKTERNLITKEEKLTISDINMRWFTCLSLTLISYLCTGENEGMRANLAQSFASKVSVCF